MDSLIHGIGRARSLFFERGKPFLVPLALSEQSIERVQ
jgi:hypothetical protein